ncbi:hypothetical protein M422DRAFT_188113, partial [Sphaerobolus stellatus SS14]
MPLLSFLGKKSKQSAVLAGQAASASNVSVTDDEYVSVNSPSTPISVLHNSPASSSRVNLPFRRKHDTPPVVPSKDPLLDPPPRQSSLFQAYHDQNGSTRSTHSLPGHVEAPNRPRPTPLQHSSAPQVTSSKKSLFYWSSKKSSGRSVPADPATDDASFNLKAFRHVRPDSPS